MTEIVIDNQIEKYCKHLGYIFEYRFDEKDGKYYGWLVINGSVFSGFVSNNNSKTLIDLKIKILTVLLEEEIGRLLKINKLVGNDSYFEPIKSDSGKYNLKFIIVDKFTERKTKNFAGDSEIACLISLISFLEQ